MPKARAFGGLLLLLLVLAEGCGAAQHRPTGASLAHLDGVRQVEGRPPVALLAREGDPTASLAVAVLTAGVDAGEGAEVPVALSALVEARLTAAGLHPSVIPGAEGFRVRLLLPEKSQARGVVTALRTALLAPVVEGGPEAALIEQKLAALARRPLPDAVLASVAECTGEPYAPRRSGAAPPVAAKTVEAWRVASHGLGRVALGAVGAPADLEIVATAVTESPAWPAGAAVAPSPPASVEDLRVYDAAIDLPAGAARVSLLLGTPEAEEAVLAARELGDPRGLLVSRLEALEPLARVREVASTRHVGWGCIAVTLDLPAPDGTADPPVTLALATDLAREELLAALGNARRARPLVRDLANQAGDPRDAAETLAYWTLYSGASKAPAGVPPGIATLVGFDLAEGRGEPALGDRAKALRAELERATAARHEPVGDARVRVERGQASLWVLVASPCGTDSETDADAGSASLAVMALAAHARHEALGSAFVDEWAAADGLGLVVHDAPKPDESAAALARRVAGVTARAFGASLAGARELGAVRGALLSRASGSEEARVFEGLADAASPGHPSWILPSGTVESLERTSDETVRARLDALRTGPLRIAVLADQDAAQGDVVVETLGAWLPRRGKRPPACAASASPVLPRPGTYLVEVPGATAAEAWLAFPVPPADAVLHAAASTLAAALDARGGLLERALGAGLARSWGARVLGPPRAPVLAVRIVSAQGSLDAAVAEVRVLFDRLRQEGLTDADRALAAAALTERALESTLDPKARLVALWRGDTGVPAAPTAEAMRAFTARTLKDEALIAVASRPPRPQALKVP